MSRSLIGFFLFSFLTFLFVVLRKQQQKKATERAERLDSGGYVPITMDDADPDVVTKSAATAARVWPGFFLALMVLVIAAVAFVAVTEPLVKAILAGTMALMAVIVARWALQKRAR